MTLKQIDKMQKLYEEMAQAESDSKAKKRLMQTSEMLAEFYNFVVDAQELLCCEILPYDSNLAKQIKRIK